MGGYEGSGKGRADGTTGTKKKNIWVMGVLFLFKEGRQEMKWTGARGTSGPYTRRLLKEKKKPNVLGVGGKKDWALSCLVLFFIVCFFFHILFCPHRKALAYLGFFLLPFTKQNENTSSDERHDGRTTDEGEGRRRERGGKSMPAVMQR